MVLSINGSIQAYLANLDHTQQQINQASSEVSSGYKIQEPSDDPVFTARLDDAPSECICGGAVQ